MTHKNQKNSKYLKNVLGASTVLITTVLMIQSAQAESMPKEKEWITTTKGCKYLVEPYDNVTWSWSGKCVDGYVEGEGILQQHVSGMSDGDLFRYEGNLIHGIKSGKGAYFAGGQKNRYKVEGRFDNNVINGPCIYTWQSGAKFNGTCKNDQMEDGTQITPDGSIQTIVNGELKSSSSRNSTSSSTGHAFGTIFKALAGAVVSVKTGDSTLLNQAVQEANSPAIPPTESNSATTLNIETSYYSDVKHGLNSNCISIGSGTRPSYNNSSEIEFINNCGKHINLFYGNPGKMSSVPIASGRKESVSFYGNAKTMKIAVCPANYNAVKPNFRQIIESGRGQNSVFMWNAENSFICWKSPQP